MVVFYFVFRSSNLDLVEQGGSFFFKGLSATGLTFEC